MVVGRPGRTPARASRPGPGRGALVRRENQENLLDPDADTQSAAEKARPEKEQPDPVAEPERFAKDKAQTQGVTHAHARGRIDAQAEEEKILSHSIAQSLSEPFSESDSNSFADAGRVTQPLANTQSDAAGRDRIPG